MDALNTFLFAEFLGKANWIWLSFIGAVVALLAFDLGVLNRKDHEIGVGESLKLSAFYIAIGLGFAFVIWHLYNNGSPTASIDPQLLAVTGSERAWTAVQLYVTGFAVEKTLALDNVFVISMVFAYLAIPRMYQHRVLFWGIIGVIVLARDHDWPGRSALVSSVLLGSLHLRRLPHHYRCDDVPRRRGSRARYKARTGFCNWLKAAPQRDARTARQQVPCPSCPIRTQVQLQMVRHAP